MEWEKYAYAIGIECIFNSSGVGEVRALDRLKVFPFNTIKM